MSVPTCRVCLKDEGLMLNILSDEMMETEKNLKTLLEECGNIVVSADDPFPKFLCQGCTEELFLAASFREKCLETDNVLRQNQECLLEEPSMTNSEQVSMGKPESVDEPNTTPDVVTEQPMFMVSQDIVEEPIIEFDGNVVVLEPGAEVEFSSELIEEELIEENEISECSAIVDIEISEDREIVNNEISESAEVATEDEAVEDFMDAFIMMHKPANDPPVQEIPESLPPVAVEQEATSLLPTSRYECEVCGASFTQPTNLKRHLLNSHGKTQLYGCGKCSHFFAEESSYEGHAAKCSGPPGGPQTSKEPKQRDGNKCYICGKENATRFALDMHMRTHTGDRPFQCSHCEKSFKTKSSLKTHEKTHSAPEHSCTVCQRKFYDSCNLRVHMRSHTGEKPHTCKVCAKSFGRVWLLQAHMRTHSGERPYQCPFCDRAFAQSCDLRSHVQRHTGILPHKCSVCGKGFVRQLQLKRHMATHGVAMEMTDSHDVGFSEEIVEYQPEEEEEQQLAQELIEMTQMEEDQ